MKKYLLLYQFCCALFLFLAFSLNGNAQDIQGTPVTMEKGITIPVSEIIKLTEEEDKKPKTLNVRDELHSGRKPKPLPGEINVPRWPPNSNQTFGTESVNAPQAIHSNFLGVRLAEGSSIPPDSQGDVGPTQICMVTNGRIKFFNKNTVCATAQTTTTASSSTVLAAPVLNLTANAFWVSVRNGEGVSDPHVRYDRLTQRWFLVIINTPPLPLVASNRVLIAVSSGPTITNLSSFTFFQFTHDAPGTQPNADNGGFFDYPTLGVDANALYVSGNIFLADGSGLIGTSVYIIRKSDLLANTLTVTPFRQIGAANGTGAGPWTPQGVHNDDPAATVGYFIGVDNLTFSLINIRRVSNPGGVPTLSGNINVSVPTTRSPILQPHLGQASGTSRLDGLDDRFFAAMIKKNKITGVSTLWTTHSIQVNTSGVGSSLGGRNGSRWYEIGSLTTVPVLVQSGTVFDPAVSNPVGFWIPSIALSGQGHAVLGSSTAGLNNRANCGIAGRYRTDALGTLQAYTNATATTTDYNVEATDGQRWGDYSQTVIDPDNDMTIWTFQEYTNNTNSWGLRAIQLKAPPPPTSSLASAVGCGSPSGINRISNITINGSSSSNEEFFDPGADAGGPGFANRLALSSTGSVTVSNLVFVNPTQFTATITWPVAIGGSAQTFTITNPDCQSITLNYSLPVGCTTLPVRYVSIKGKDIGKKVLLSWQTSFEENNDYFEVEKKGPDGKFYPIQTVLGKGNTNGDSYEITDMKPLAENYYRLKQVNKDFTYHYSDIVYVKIKTTGKLNIYPNPAQSTVIVESPVEFLGGQIRVFNIAGVVVSTSVIKELFQQVNVGNMNAGTYIIEIQSPKGVKQRIKLTVDRNDP